MCALSCSTDPLPNGTTAADYAGDEDDGTCTDWSQCGGPGGADKYMMWALVVNFAIFVLCQLAHSRGRTLFAEEPVAPGTDTASGSVGGSSGDGSSGSGLSPSYSDKDIQGNSSSMGGVAGHRNQQQYQLDALGAAPRLAITVRHVDAGSLVAKHAKVTSTTFHGSLDTFDALQRLVHHPSLVAPDNNNNNNNNNNNSSASNHNNNSNHGGSHPGGVSSGAGNGGPGGVGSGGGGSGGVGSGTSRRERLVKLLSAADTSTASNAALLQVYYSLVGGGKQAQAADFTLPGASLLPHFSWASFFFYVCAIALVVLNVAFLYHPISALPGGEEALQVVETILAVLSLVFLFVLLLGILVSLLLVQYRMR